MFATTLPNERARAPLPIAVGLATAVLLLGACTSDANGDDMTIDEQFEAAAEQEVVDETSTSLDPATNTLNVGGLTVTWEPFGRDPDNETIFMEAREAFPQQWPVLTMPYDFSFVDQDLYSASVAVLQQRSMVLDDTARNDLISLRYRIIRAALGEPGEWGTLAHEQTLTGTDPDTTCYFHDRTGQYASTDDHITLIFTTGPGIAGISWIVYANNTPTGITQLGDLTQAICGQRPDGY